MTTCGGCGATLRPGAHPDCCAAKTAEKQRAADAKTISDLRGHVGSLKARERAAYERGVKDAATAAAAAVESPDNEGDSLTNIADRAYDAVRALPESKPPEAEATARAICTFPRAHAAGCDCATPNVEKARLMNAGRVRITSPNAYDASKGDRPHDPTLEPPSESREPVRLRDEVTGAPIADWSRPSESRATAERAAGEAWGTCSLCGAPREAFAPCDECGGSGKAGEA